MENKRKIGLLLSGAALSYVGISLLGYASGYLIGKYLINPAFELMID